MTHSLQRTVRINGNEYAHIWETPLPDPKGRRHSKQQQPGPLHPTCRLEITKDPSGKNTFYTCTRYTHPWVKVCQEVLNLMVTIITCVQKPTGLCLEHRHQHRHTLPEVERVTFCSPNATPTGTAVGGCMVRPLKGLLSLWRPQPPASAVELPAPAEGWPVG